MQKLMPPLHGAIVVSETYPYPILRIRYLFIHINIVVATIRECFNSTIMYSRRNNPRFMRLTKSRATIIFDCLSTLSLFANESLVC